MKYGTRANGVMALVVARSDLHDGGDDVSYWLTRSPEERIAAVEVLRRRMFGSSNEPGSRLQRVCNVTKK
jgi:hypothetical protein